MAEADEQAAGSGGKKKLILIVVIALVLIGASVGGTLLATKFLGGDQGAGDAAAAPEAAVAEPAAKAKSSAIYFPLKPTIIVNFNARGKQRFLQAEVSLLVRDFKVVTAIEEHSMMLQHGLLMLFSAQDYTELQTAEGKELLRQQALAEVQRLLEQEIGEPGVEQLLFTNLVMQ
ncbi:MAG: flagellar basal body-associated protein FliL [Gammaproteobacteria bacterium]|uniref:flagellar basal body-associated FliL family protein n=1 Tax=Pseudomaricurvus alcaniphilus TaxID=1166482 RepID=UPI001409105E|nr:flagellar basal body-associated FliL family protein [Pseudomaricurvus alcaniphilus]MBR9911636.1 flagellar basal body-associated protein FliL [Gammaproteobacteria bacterium]NHN39420.1 flagellar basal body-associated protein FliL [Pseudomaricurvus alcaniphilus]